jgi:tRNA (cmo5U34)-methyltransferase
MSTFSDLVIASNYAETTERLVPGLRDLHRMAGLLLAERVPSNGCVLVLGAGGGLELKAFAQMQPSWRFTGLDPSAEMLNQARATLGDMASRVHLHEGYIDDAPEGPFDGATCLLTLHFLPEAERRRTLEQIRERLAPGAPFICAHHSFPDDEAGKQKWLARFAAFAVSSGMPASQFENIIAKMKEHLPVLSPQKDADLLRDAGFKNIEMFYCAFTFKGWVADSA